MDLLICFWKETEGVNHPGLNKKQLRRSILNLERTEQRLGANVALSGMIGQLCIFLDSAHTSQSTVLAARNSSASGCLRFGHVESSRLLARLVLHNIGRGSQPRHTWLQTILAGYRRRQTASAHCISDYSCRTWVEAASLSVLYLNLHLQDIK